MLRASLSKGSALLFCVVLSLSSQNAVAGNTLTGQVLAGATPIKHATVTLYGTVETCIPDPCGLVPRPVEETTADADGRFSLDLSKARAKVQETYGRTTEEQEQAPRASTFFVVASGGDVGKGINRAIKLVTVFGKPPLEGQVIVNELTTVVAAFLLKNATLGGLARIQDGFTLLRQLVDPITGHLRPVFDRGANSPALVNTLADILHGCVTSSGPGSNECGALFKAATLQRYNERPDNTLDAAENIASTWGRGQSSAFELLPKERPFTPVLDHPPVGWLLSLNFDNLGLHRPTQIFADLSDRTLWILNRGNNSLAELSTAPEDLTAPLLGERILPSAVRNHPIAFWFKPICCDFESRERPKTPGWFAQPSAWLVGDKLIFLKKNGKLCGTPLKSLDLKDAAGITSCFVLGNGLCIANAGANEIVAVNQPDYARCDAAKLLGKLKDGLAGTPNLGLAEPTHVVSCFSNNIATWIANRANSTVTAFDEIDRGVRPLPGVPFHGGGLAEPEDLTCDGDGNVWIANNGQNSVSAVGEFFDGHRTVLRTLSPESGFSGAGMDRPYGIAIDGLGNVWVTNEGNDSLTVFIGAGQVPL